MMEKTVMTLLGLKDVNQTFVPGIIQVHGALVGVAGERGVEK